MSKQTKKALTPVRVYEHDTIRVGRPAGFESRHLKALVAFNEVAVNRDKYFTLAYNGVRFKEFVGVLQADDLTIEVLPKADRNAGEEQKDQWRGALIDMLKTCRLLQIEKLDTASLNLKKNSILEIYCQIFLTECARLVREGLIRKYRLEEGNNLALKGQLLFAQNIVRNVTHNERFFVRSQVYDRKNIFNAILYTTLKAIPSISSNPHNHSRSFELLAAFPDIDAVTPTADLFENIVYDRKTERYRNALFISRLLLLHFRPDIKGGRQSVLAIMFNMNVLWEEYIFRKLKKAESDYNVQISRQASTRFWKNDATGRSKKVRPDVVIRFPGGLRKPIVIDTKWKTPANLNPSDQDLKQLYIYNQYWDCNESYLLYPATENARREGSFYSPTDSKLFSHHCHVLATTIFLVDALGYQRLNGRIGFNLLGKILGDKLMGKVDGDQR